MSKLTCFAAVLATLALNVAAQTTATAPREKLLLDCGWKFYLGDDWGTGENLTKAGISTGPADPVFCDAAMRVVNLPHDWLVELPFDSKADRSHGFKPAGKKFSENSVAWYRRTFTLAKEDVGKRIWLDFDGVFRDCLVFVNGYRIGRHESGYDSFRYDITDVANCGGENSVAVRVDVSNAEGWFYEGAGIYRHVWLEKTALVAIAPDGIFVYSKFENNVPGPTVEVDIKTQVTDSQTNEAAATVAEEIFGPDGKTIGTAEQRLNLKPFSKEEAKLQVKFPNPVLWSPESPKLYKLITTVLVDGAVTDRQETEFGVRTFAFDADKGFLLNGQPYVIHGTCNHQDHAGVGAAMPDALQYFRIAKLKEFGCNAYRTSHNAPTPELLEACDRLGMLVMDENRILGSDAENMTLLEGQIRRDRNHASVFLWSIANEEHVQALPASARMAETMQRDVHRLDPTRLVTSAVSLGDVFTGINSVMDVRGWNYHQDGADSYHQKHPAQPSIGSEQASTVTTRGIYEDDAEHGYVTAYDGKPKAGQSAEGWWRFFAERPWLSGGFVWTGFDYRGEPTPYGWPCINSHFGIVDTCGFAKDNFYYYQSWWTDKPVLHLLPHWNWPGREGRDIDVRALSNCEEVELFLNGQSQGRKTMKKNSQLQWNVKYAPGTLSAKGFDHGLLVAQTIVETTGEATAVQLAPDRPAIHADGEDLSIVTVSITAGAGRRVPTANRLVHFTIDGPGKIIGVGNGDPSCHEPDVCVGKAGLRSGTMNEWWISTVTKMKDLREVSEKFNDTRWDMADTTGASGMLKAGETGVYRAHLFVPEKDVALTNITIHFGRVAGEGAIYVNGEPAGQTQEGALRTFNLRKFLHAGVNTVAVVVKSQTEGGGLSGGVWVELADAPVTADWQRSTFNGLAQVIVQADKAPGEIKLTASAEGLLPATLVIAAEPSTLRLAAP